MYATNTWNAAQFPFLSQKLFYENGSDYDQLAILNADFSLNEAALAEQGIPWYAASNAIYYLGCNLAIGATLTHVAIWYWRPILNAIKGFRTRTIDDPHYQKMLVYKEVPMWVYGGIILASFAMAMATCCMSLSSFRPARTTFLTRLSPSTQTPVTRSCRGGRSSSPSSSPSSCSVSRSHLLVLAGRRRRRRRRREALADPARPPSSSRTAFVCVIYAITGFKTDVQQLAQMLGAALVPGISQANMVRRRSSLSSPLLESSS